LNDSINPSINEKQEPSAIFRWTILIVVSLAMFGNYYVFDSISPLADVLSKQLNFTDSDIGTLNGIYSLPNLFMVLIGGLIIDRIGTRVSSFLFAVICFIGAILTAFSGGDLIIMAAGRLIFGLGAESLIVAVTTVLGRWFKGKQLSFAFGINLTIARLGSFAALNSPTWAKSIYADWQGPLIIAAVIGFVSVLASAIYWILDNYSEKKHLVHSVDEQDKIDVKEFFIISPARVVLAVCIIAVSIIFIPGNLKFVVSLSTLLFFIKFSFGKSYVYIILLCVTFYSAIFPFQTFAVKFFMEVHGTTREEGGFLSSLLILSSMILTPIFGLLSDYIGRRSLLMMFGSLILIPVYSLMMYTDINLLIPMAAMGLSFSLIPAIMWPSVAYIIPEAKLGTAYGLMTMVQAIGLAGFNFLIGWVNDFSGSYEAGMWIFSSLGFFGLVFAYLLRRNELSPEGHGLEKGIKEFG
jgi:MFS family permease